MVSCTVYPPSRYLGYETYLDYSSCFVFYVILHTDCGISNSQFSSESSINSFVLNVFVFHLFLFLN